MTKSDGLVYKAPLAVRLGDAANARGGISCVDGGNPLSCVNGSTDISCGPGNGATAHCDDGNSASGCLTGTLPGTSTCRPGNTPMGGCTTGTGVQQL
jgi:hypothetical protein